MKKIKFETKIQKINSLKNLNEQLEEAINLITNNDILAFPTETVYGLGANALSESAVKKIFEAKGRPSDNPIIIHVSSLEMFEDLIDKNFLDKRIKKLQKYFWPGPLTLIVKKSDKVPYITTGGLETVAIRMPSNPIALELIKKSNLPIAAPSANLSGKPSPTTAVDVYEDMNGRIKLIIDGGSTVIGLESTVLDVSDPLKVPIILRPGKVTKSQLEECLGINIELYDSSTVNGYVDQTQPKSPGMRYRHYAPNAEVFIVSNFDELLEQYKEFITKNRKIGVIIDKKYMDESTSRKLNIDESVFFKYSNNEELGTNLYLKLREMDKKVSLIIIQFDSINGNGFELAIKNRLLKASSKK